MNLTWSLIIAPVAIWCLLAMLGLASGSGASSSGDDGWSDGGDGGGD